MSVTTTKDQTIKEVLNRATPGELADALRKLALGTMFTPLKLVKTGLTAAASFDITSAALGSNPAALGVFSLRVTASGTANSVGSYSMSDAAGTPVSPTAGANVGLATISDDGKTITFPTTVTAFVMEYLPRPAADLSGLFANS